MARVARRAPADAVTSQEVARAHAIAARAKCDARTALRAVRQGPEAIRTRTIREAVTAALAELAAEDAAQ